jgi:hypothetical protein
MALKTGALGCRSVPSADRYGGQMKFRAAALRGLRNANQGSAQIAFDVHSQRFDGRNVYDATALGGRRDGREHEAIDAGEKGGKSLAGSGRSEDQSGFATSDGWPTGKLRASGSGENGLEPVANGGMEKAQDVRGRGRGGYEFGVWWHVAKGGAYLFYPFDAKGSCRCAES